MPEYDPRVRRRIYYAETLAYILIVTIAVAGFVSADRQRQGVCHAVYDNRQAVRDLTVAIKHLGRDLVLGDPPAGSITPDQRETLRQFSQFEREQLQELDLPIC